MQEFLYGYRDGNFQCMLRDLDMATNYEYCDTNSVISALENAGNNHNLCNTMDKCNRMLVTYDKLAVCDTAFRDAINDILHRMAGHESQIKYITHNMIIINHQLTNTDLLKLYARTNAYNPLYGYVYVRHEERNDWWRCQLASDNKYLRMCQDAALNGLRVTNIEIWDGNISDDDIKHYAYLTGLNICRGISDICSLASCAFAKSLKILTIPPYGLICDASLSRCNAIEKLDVQYNRKITTCAPFAKSLKVLNASGGCGIDNKGLELCTSIIELVASSNDKITTCTPFAKSLKVLDAQGSECGIGDAALKSCTIITKLVACDNYKITTCVPFSCTLTTLDASDGCGIGDAGLKTCHSIKHLNAFNNSKMTTCTPFSDSLRYLNATGVKCGITTTGIRSCKSLIVLDSYNNVKIDRRQIQINGREKLKL